MVLQKLKYMEWTDEQVDNFLKYADKKQNWFWHRTFFNYHLSLYRDWRNFGLASQFSIDEDTERNCLINIWFLFFGLEYSWNGRNILCWFGWHKWSWKLSDVKIINNEIPDCAECKKCGVSFKQL